MLPLHAALVVLVEYGIFMNFLGAHRQDHILTAPNFENNPCLGNLKGEMLSRPCMVGPRCEKPRKSNNLRHLGPIPGAP